MPFVGVGLHLLVALFFAVHVVRSGQPIFWLFILFSFPLLGSIVYFVAIWLPNSRLQHGARKVVSVAAKSFDPTRELREARAAFDYTPTAQNQMRLASALLEAGQPEEAARNYEACLKGPFATDPDIRFGAARAFVAAGRPHEAIDHLAAIRGINASFRVEQVALLLAEALAAAGRADDAKAEYEAAAARFGSFAVFAEYAIWASSSGDMALAERLRGDAERSMQRWDRSTRDLNRPLIRRLESAFAGRG
jgi:hypothetical protein